MLLICGFVAVFRKLQNSWRSQPISCWWRESMAGNGSLLNIWGWCLERVSVRGCWWSISRVSTWQCRRNKNTLCRWQWSESKVKKSVGHTSDDIWLHRIFYFSFFLPVDCNSTLGESEKFYLLYGSLSTLWIFEGFVFWVEMPLCIYRITDYLLNGLGALSNV